MLRVSSALVVCASVLVAAATLATSSIRMTDVTARAGIDFITDSSPTPNKNQPETMVSGIALLDYDRDGDQDVYFVNGAAIPSLKKDHPRFWNRLYRNDGAGTFTDVTEKARVAGEGYGMGVASADYDNDGYPDLFLANVTHNQLLRNKGDGTFEDVTGRAGLPGGIYKGRKMWSVAAAWLDFENDGDLDLFVSNYCVWEVNKDPFCGPRPELRAYCHPKNYDPLPNQLYRNNGDGTFTDISAETGVAKYFGKGMGIVLADYNSDGFTDVFIANDTMPNFLFRNVSGRRFEDAGLEAGVAYLESGAVISGMGAEFKDVNNDGLPDIWHTAIENETFPLFLNRGKGLFQEITGRSGLGRPTRNMSGWSNAIVDLDNDGWKDLVVARGNVLDNVAQLAKRDYCEPNSVIRNFGGMKFEEVSAGPDFAKAAPHRGLVYGDLDNDGRMDLVFTQLQGRASVYRNASDTTNHWLLLHLRGTKSNRDGIGALVTVTAEDGTKQWNMNSTSSGYGCSSDERVHFGLGAAKLARTVEIAWPSGIRQVLTDVAADRIVKIEEPAK